MGESSSAAALASIIQLTDSNFPTGMYTLSHGLEGFVHAGEVTGPTLEAWIDSVLRHAVGPADTVALVLAHRAVTATGAEAGSEAEDAAAVAEVCAIDRRLHATKLGREARDSARRTGRQLVDLAADLAVAGAWPRPGVVAGIHEAIRQRRARGCQGAVAGAVYAAAGVGEHEAALADLTALVLCVAGAALRLRLVDHREAQLLTARLHPVIAEVIADARHRAEDGLDAIGGCAPLWDIASARHERAPARLFMS